MRNAKDFLICILVLMLPFNVLAEDYYWVGGTGNWSDLNHWATISGGVVLHAQIPTPDDDVFFDGNSFNSVNQIVTINQKNAVCRNMDWSGAGNIPELIGHDTTSLRIYGDLELIHGMLQQYNGELIFESLSTGKTITSAGHSILSNVRFLGIGGGWQLQDDFDVIGNIYFVHGGFETNGHQLNCRDFLSLEPNNRTINLSTSQLNLTSWQIDGRNLSLQATQAEFNIENLLSNINGNPLFYRDIHFFGFDGAVSNSNVYATYQDIDFAFSGSISGDCKINTVTTIGSGNISDSDSINQVLFNGGGSISGGHHVIGTFIGKGNSAISGENEIGVALFYAPSRIVGTNTIDSARFFAEGIISESNQIRKLIITKYGIVEGSNTIQEALFLNDAYFNGGNNFNVLTLSPGNTYTFAIYDKQTIHSELNVVGDCYKPIRMLSDTNGVQATIKCDAPVNGDFLSLRDLKAEGSTPFVATNSVNLGNNTNWNIQTATGLNLYWVNGQGNWDDPNHWDLNSGGSGGHCPPTEIDNALFDANSFTAGGQSATINIKNAVCHDMNWENVASPRLMGPDTCNLRVYGSLKLSPQMQWLFLGQTYFEATMPGKTITTAGNIFKNDNWFNGRGGSWTLMDEFQTNGWIKFQQGEVYTIGNDVTCAVFSSTDTTTRKLRLSTSTVTMTAAFKKVWNLNATNLKLFADSSLLVSEAAGADIYSFNGEPPLVYHNVEFYGFASRLLNGVYCNYNLVSFYDSLCLVKGDCTIDTVTFHEIKGTVEDSDTIKTAIFYERDGFLDGGEHNIEIAYFYDDGRILGANNIDTCLFYKNGIIEGDNTIDTCIIYNKAGITGANQIRTATFLGDGNIFGTNTFYDLTFSKAHSYYLESGKTQTIHDNFNIDGSCTGPIILQSDINQSQATIHKINGSVEANYLALRDIAATGPGIPFVTYNSVDMGNNSNWEIHTSDPKELYWVNGTGVWSDSLHWSGSSGGIGGYCIPSPIDNVYFDENSFSIINDAVIVNMGNATCHNMSWEGAKFEPVFVGPDTNNLRIFGSVHFILNMQFQIFGPVFFESTHGGNTIRSNGNVFLNKTYIQGIGGKWELDDKFACDSTVFFSNGEILTYGNPMDCWSFNSDYTNPRAFYFDGSTISFKGSAIEVWYVNGINLSLEAENTLFIIDSVNALFRTDFGGPFEFNNLLFRENRGRIYNNSVSIAFNRIDFMGDGQVHGNCEIDSVLFIGSGSLFDADKINAFEVRGDLGYIEGNHNIKTLKFWNKSEILGSNSFDSILIQGTSLFSGNNTVNQYMQIGSTARIEGSNSVENALLLGDGRFNGANTFNTLSFSPGNKYELEEGTTQTINNAFNIHGNNCFPITLHSQSDGSQAFISAPPAVNVSGDFIEMRDIGASGGAEFFAGKYSTDISNNSGWNFNNSPGYIYGFPADTTLCEGQELIVGTENFNPDENSIFLWQDGSTASEFHVTDEDSLWVTVNYANDCFYTDTIHIGRGKSPEVNIGDDRIICEGDTISIISANDSLTYLWSDGSTDNVFTVFESGIVSVIATASNGCSATDSIEVIANPKPIVFLGNDTTLRSDQTILLDAGNSGSTYSWSTGDTVQSIVVNGSQELVWVNVDFNGCLGNDTIVLNEFPKCIIAVPNAFSPNGDGQNDILYVRGSGFGEFELMIFNRIGEMVFKTNDESIGWNGTFKGKAQEVDAYMYLIQGRCIDGQEVLNKGNITLLR